MKVREIMTAPAVTVDEDCSLERAAHTMVARKIGCLPVVDAHDEICGVVTESDFAASNRGVPFSLYRFPQLLGEWMPREGVERIYQAARNRKVGEIMSRGVVSVTEEDTLETLLERMLTSGFHRLPVLRGKTPVGIVARHDLLQLLVSRTP